MNMATIVTLVVVLAVAALAVWRCVKKGMPCECGCGGKSCGCGHCKGAADFDKINNQTKGRNNK